jgi:SNF2 family DNA or RNA helicase
MLVVCQANMRLKWVLEIEKWKVAQGLTVGHAEGDNYPDTDIVVINYDIAARHEEKLRARKWDIIVKDEAHNQKNHEAKRTIALMGDLLDQNGGNPLPLAEGGLVLEMSGTPKPNRVSELWPLLTSTRPDIWGRGPEARQMFIDRYEPPFLIKKQVGKGARAREIIIPIAGKPMREEELNLRMFGSGSMIRRLKRDTNLPPKMRSSIPIPIRLTKADREMLKEAEAVIGRIGTSNGLAFNASDPTSAGAIIDVVQGLSPQSPDFQEIARVRRNLGLLKAPHAARFVIDELAEEDDMAEELRTKTVVFAHHKEVIRIIAELAREKYPDGVCVYDGSMGPKAKQKAVDDFQENPEKRLFIMSLSGATGITLTAASRLRSVEMDWSPSNVSQIEDRIWRIGQMASCHIGYLFIPDSLDVTIGNTIVTKMESDERTLNRPYFSLRMGAGRNDSEVSAPALGSGSAIASAVTEVPKVRSSADLKPMVSRTTKQTEMEI